jgi:hypothetical protein
MKRLFLALGLQFFTAYTVSAIDRIGLKEGIDHGLLKLNAYANGNGYHNKSLRLSLTNTGNKALQVVVEPALIFRPDDTSYQDFVLAGNDMVTLKGKGTIEINAQVFCGKSHAAAPARNLHFNFLKAGDDKMVKLMAFINQHKLYDGLGQDAIWALTDMHELHGVYDPNRPELSKQLLEFMSKLTGWPAPEYYKQYAPNPRGNGPVVPPKALKMLALFDWKLDSPKQLTLGIYDKDGRMIQPVVENREFSKGGHRVRVEFEAEGVDAGTYYIRLMDNANVMKELAVRVD